MHSLNCNLFLIFIKENVLSSLIYKENSAIHFNVPSQKDVSVP
jgi:hypothetical protein